jgi:ABC-type amino acid transport substrate-binding protein
MPVRRIATFLLLVLFLGAGGLGMAETPSLRVAVLEDAPPLSYRDKSGQLTGFTTLVMRALCAEMEVNCDFQATRLEHLVEELAANRYDVAAAGLLNTPERRQKILFSRPVYRSLTLFFARAGIQPGQRGVRVSTFRGSAQERYIKEQGWDYVGAHNEGEMLEQLKAGVTQACIVPLMTSLSLQRNSRFLQLDLQMNVLNGPELDGNASFGISPQRADLKPRLDKAIEKLKLNGVYDRINSQFLPFRVD